MTDATLRATQVNISIVNPQTNQYSRVGTMILLAVRKGGQIQLIVLKPDKSPFFGIQATPQVDWTIQNDVYVSMVSGIHRFLLQFGNAAECQMFTMFALSAKVAASPEPIMIIDRKGGPISSDRFKVSYKCYDLNADKVQDPCMSEDNLELSSSDQSPVSAISKSGTQNSIFLVNFARNVIAIATSIGEELPSVGGASSQSHSQQASQEAEQGSAAAEEAATAETSAPESKPQKAGSDSQQQMQQQRAAQQQIAAQVAAATGAAPPSSASAAAAAAATPSKAAATPASKAKTPAKKTPAPAPVQAPPPAPKPQYEAQLQSIHNEVQTKFEELSQMIASLRRSQVQQSALPLSSDVLVSSVQRLLRENQMKDQLIAEKQQLIDLLNERHSDTRERDDLRVQLSELSQKLSNQRQITRAKTEKQDELNHEIETLQEKLVQVKQESERRLGALQQQLDEEKQKQTDELDNQRKQLEFNAKQAEEEVVRVREQFEKALSENKALKAQASRDITSELNRLKEQMPQLINKTVRQMVQGVYGLVTDSFDEDEEYDGMTITKAIKNALRATSSRVLRQIDPDEDDEDEEEEEEEDDDDDQ